MEAILARTFTPSRMTLMRQFVRFGIVGLAGFAVDNATVYGLRGAIGLYWSGLVAYLLAATTTWALNRVWTFRGAGSGSMHRQWLSFLAANALGFVLNRGTYVLLISQSQLCWDNPVLAIFAGMLAGMFLNFHLSRTMVFR